MTTPRLLTVLLVLDIPRPSARGVQLEAEQPRAQQGGPACAFALLDSVHHGREQMPVRGVIARIAPGQKVLILVASQK